MSVITSHAPLPWVAKQTRTLLAAAYAAGAAALAAIAALHVQQYVVEMHLVPWIGPLFLANAAGCAAVVAGLAFRPVRPLAALSGVAVAALTLAGLVVSYGQGLLGWREVGWRAAIAADVIATVVAMLALSLALALAAVRRDQ
jgi:hypothetical protein